MRGREPPGPSDPIRVVHYARTALAAQAIADAAARPGVVFRRVDRFGDLLAECGRADLVLLTDPGRAPAERLAARLDALDRPVALHLLSAGREGFAGWTPRPHVAFTTAGSALAPTVAEHAMALLLALRRGLHRLAVAPGWTRDQKLAGLLGSLDGARLLVLGCGHVGRAVALRARPFGARVTGLNRSPVAQGAFDATGPLSALDDYLPAADAAVLCLPLTPDTAGLIGAARLARMRPGAIVINVGRGGVADEAALAAALTAGHLGGAGIDVFETEPLPPESPLWRAPNAILTPHVAGLGGPGEARIGASVGAAIDRIRAGATAPNPKEA